MGAMSNPERLGQILVRAQLIDALQLRAALAQVSQWGTRLTRAVVDMGLCDEARLSETLAKTLRLHTVKLETISHIPTNVLALVNADYARSNGLLPLELRNKNKTLLLAMSDPTDLEVIDFLSRKIRARVETVVAGETQIQKAIRRFYFHAQGDEGTYQAGFYSGETVFTLNSQESSQPAETLSNNWVEWKATEVLTPLSEPVFALEDEEGVEEVPNNTSLFTEEHRLRLKVLQDNQAKISRMVKALKELLAEKGYS